MNTLTLKTTTTALALIFTALLSTPSTVYSSGSNKQPVTWYQIEVILFKNIQPYELDKEHVTIDIPSSDQHFVLVKGKPMVSNQLQRLDPSKLTLTKSFNALKRSKNYKVLEFSGWKQPLIKDQPGTPLIITSGEQYGPHYELEGTLTFRKSRYLHLHADLFMADYTLGPAINMKSWLLEDDNVAARITQLNDPTNNSNTASNASRSMMLNHIIEQTNKTNQAQQGDTNTPDLALSSQDADTNYTASNIVHLDESRRMRSGEIHYLDHPKFGLLVTIEPTDPPFVYNPR
ncbi:peptidoglycan binding protein CsiV [Alkalimarinus alittae]|uniref:Peptidoglycan binding protein CsiV n=1 Tax=Alkalimarinus alittae TaxID=2961619 RepID=A0ABY6MY78_9ALTE|nr:peptidoglycan binding protein CsiV [Alkalimarinus alittae]UZE94742.1 peptidoglycan binding protein CsiV [Alkalimarinus alittae]